MSKSETSFNVEQKAVYRDEVKRVHEDRISGGRVDQCDIDRSSGSCIDADT
ncbi:hypothetical protein [Gimesia fumaroli]|jgi:hypothetical protein|uniref:Uncharacterized protein n=1 Tax=Gimesia fumaroli TaxID=2527976 RepID=A0A518ICZ0_9PLAN|nr:hypothetical protein [Gimesia fumaroli]QDV50972.1 hypothetical protein Enr17x_30170 [Gimesia fumaroli]